MLPAPGQGPCARCGHYPLVHGTVDGNPGCHHMDEWEGDGPAPMHVYCTCAGYQRRTVAVGPLPEPEAK
jgi:hypothetical protein